MEFRDRFRQETNLQEKERKRLLDESGDREKIVNDFLKESGFPPCVYTEGEHKQVKTKLRSFYQFLAFFASHNPLQKCENFIRGKHLGGMEHVKKSFR